MASGDTLLIFSAYNNEPPSASYATLDTRNQRPVLDFADSGSEAAVFGAVLPRAYSGGGLTVNHWVAFSSGTTGSGVIRGYWERTGSVLDLDDDSFTAGSVATFDVPANAGSAVSIAIAFTNGANIDNLEVGEYFRYKVAREGENTNDTGSGDLEIVQVEIVET